MGTYRYTFISAEIPAIPILPIQIKTPNSSAIVLKCQAILDTGSDATLIPIPFLVKVKAKAQKQLTRIPIGGNATIGISYQVGLTFGQFSYSKISVFGCPIDDSGELLIIGRDLMNLHRLEFNGQNLTFTIF